MDTQKSPDPKKWTNEKVQSPGNGHRKSMVPEKWTQKKSGVRIVDIEIV
jgi:hypothetical protein